MKGSVIAIVICGLLAVACGSIQSGGSSCGPPYVANVNSQTVPADSCAGVIPTHPMRFSLAVRHQFQIEIGHEESGALDFPVPEPAGPSVRVRHLSSGTHRHGASYRAPHPVLPRNRSTSALMHSRDRSCDVMTHPALCTHRIIGETVENACGARARDARLRVRN